MSAYSPLPGPVQELAGLVRDFQKRTKKLREYSGQIGTKQDTKELRSQIQSEREAGLSLSKRISDILRQKPVNRVDKANMEKLIKEFEIVFAEFERINQATLEKERMIVDVIHETMQSEVYRRTGVVSSEDPDLQRQTMLFQEIGAFDEAALRERQEEIRLLEKDMHEASTLFKDVAQMVSDQGNLLAEAEQHVTVAVVETDKAVDELGKAETYQKRSRSKIIWIMVCVVVLIAVVVVPIVVLK